jgi:hypothetical protein
MAEGSTTVSDDELVYRRIPDSQKWYDSSVSPYPSDQAFTPQKLDADGLSLSTASHTTPKLCAASGTAGKLYWVAVLSVGELRRAGFSIVSDYPGHCLIPAMTYATKKSDENVQRAFTLSRMCLRIEGPFTGTKERP